MQGPNRVPFELHSHSQKSLICPPLAPLLGGVKAVVLGYSHWIRGSSHLPGECPSHRCSPHPHQPGGVKNKFGLTVSSPTSLGCWVLRVSGFGWTWTDTVHWVVASDQGFCALNRILIVANVLQNISVIKVVHWKISFVSLESIYKSCYHYKLVGFVYKYEHLLWLNLWSNAGLIKNVTG